MPTEPMQTGRHDGPCDHETVEPVLVDAEHVADVCTRCLAALAPGYRCDDCDWDETTEHTYGGDTWTSRYRAHACPAHRP